LSVALIVSAIPAFAQSMTPEEAQAKLDASQAKRLAHKAEVERYEKAAKTPRKTLTTWPTTNPAEPSCTLCGVSEHAKRIVIVWDTSGSMLGRESRTKDDVCRTIDGLSPDQSFDIICFSDVATCFDEKKLVAATPENRRKADEFIRSQKIEGATDPVAAVHTAFSLDPQLIFFVSDGYDEVESVSEVFGVFRGNNPDLKVQVDCFYADTQHIGPDADRMLKIANDNRGRFTVMPDD
jgi:hypothetical protein